MTTLAQISSKRKSGGYLGKEDFPIQKLNKSVLTRCSPKPDCHPEPTAKDLCLGSRRQASESTFISFPA